jgi:glycosyltransferase involved in cell wall biosynthesis/GT2 family glycosyltransferase
MGLQVMRCCGEYTQTSTECDLVVPVYNALDATLDLFESIVRFTKSAYRVYVVDDCSHTYVGLQLRKWCETHNEFTYARNETNQGYIKSTNRGLLQTTAPFICLLNSDTVVTEGWLERLIRAAKQDSSLAILNPITNHAANIAVPLPPGFTIHMMSQFLRDKHEQESPYDVVTNVGFCFFMPRSTMERFGLLDETYGLGYCEESDYCMKVLDAGLRGVVVPSAFVFHRGSASFDSPFERYCENRKRFDRRWLGLYQRLYLEFQKNDHLRSLRRELYDGLQLHSTVYQAMQPAAIRRLSLKAWALFREGAIIELLRKVERLGVRFLKKIADQVGRRVLFWANRLKKALSCVACGEFGPLISKARQAVAHWSSHADASSGDADSNLSPDLFKGINAPKLSVTCFYPDSDYVEKLPRDEKRMRIIFLVWALQICGGVTKIVQLANGLVINGHDAIIVTLDKNCDAAYLDRLFTRPLLFGSEEQLINEFPEADIVVSTFWLTAYYWLPRLLDHHCFVPIYYVQDFEPDFYQKGSSEYAWALSTYHIPATRVTSSDHLVQKLRSVGADSVKIPYGLDLGVFYPQRERRWNSGKRDFVVTAMARPETPRRGFEVLVKMCEILHQQDVSIKFRLFGCAPDVLQGLSFPVESTGIISSPYEMARHLHSCDLLVDPSLFQGWGLCALEAMACGLPTVITRSGGCSEYARDGINTIMVSPNDPDALAASVLEVRRHPEIQQRLGENGQAMAQRFSTRKEIQEHLTLYETLLSQRTKRSFSDRVDMFEPRGATTHTQ